MRLTRVADALPAYDAVSTAIVAHDVPTEIGDLYRLFLVLLNSSKPVVTGAFTPRGSAVMIELLALDAGGSEALRERPRAVFDVCPSPPLTWSEFACRNVMDLGRAGVPAELISMPLAGVASPVTLVGSIVQHAAESLAGVVLHQLAAPGAPIVWGGAPTIVDMRTGSTPMGAIETAMIDAGYAAVGKSLGLPCHAYLGATDAKIIDAQAGLESGMTALVGGLAGIDMISGAGMLDFLLAQSPEKLVIDADMIGMVQRLLRGIGTPTETLATGFFEQAGPEGRFLELRGHAAAVPHGAVPAVEGHRPQLASGVGGRGSARRLRAGAGAGGGAAGHAARHRARSGRGRDRWPRGCVEAGAPFGLATLPGVAGARRSAVASDPAASGDGRCASAPQLSPRHRLRPCGQRAPVSAIQYEDACATPGRRPVRARRGRRRGGRRRAVAVTQRPSRRSRARARLAPRPGEGGTRGSSLEAPRGLAGHADVAGTTWRGRDALT